MPGRAERVEFPGIVLTRMSRRGEERLCLARHGAGGGERWYVVASVWRDERKEGKRDGVAVLSLY